MGNTILVIGSANIDLVVKLDTIPKPGETIGGGQFHQFCGGKGANQAVAAAKSGHEVVFAGLVGEDAYGEAVIENLKAASVDTQYVGIEKSFHTGLALISVSQSGENAISIAPGANRKLKPKYIDKLDTIIESSTLILLQLEIPFDTCAEIVRRAARLGTPVMLNPAPSCREAADLVGSVELLVVNEHEASDISGISTGTDDEIEMAAEWLLNQGASHVVVTLGKRGAYLRNSGKRLFLPALDVEAMDTTGAGDAFCGALASEYSKTGSIEAGLKYAMASSALSVTRMGAQEALPSRSEVERILKAAE